MSMEDLLEVVQVPVKTGGFNGSSFFLGITSLGLSC
jgi:hypothetical protein